MADNIPFFQTDESNSLPAPEHVVDLSDPAAAEPEKSEPKDLQLDFEYTFEINELDPGLERVYLPPATTQEMSDRLSEVPKGDIAGSRQGEIWMEAITQSPRSSVYASGLVDPLSDTSRDWVQGIETEKGKLFSSIPNLKSRSGTKLVGDRARTSVRHALKMGVTFNVALWHSGFWIRMRAPSETEFLELYRMINAEKLSLGRTTYGLIFSNNSSYTTRLLLDFAIEHIHDTSLDLPDGQDIRAIISVHDLPILFWALACAHWPNGFQYSRPCISDPTKCTHVVNARLALNRLQFTDRNSLTRHQRQHMTSAAPRSMTMDSIQRYKEEFLRGVDRQVEIKAGAGSVRLVLKNPTAAGHVQAGFDWINNIEESYPASLGMGDRERDTYLYTQGRATVMRQYSHYVSKIIVDGSEYDDADTVNGILGDLSADDQTRRDFMREVAKFIDDSVVSMIAIPTYTCPSCGGAQNVGRETTKHPDYIPLDVNAVFFSLVAQRVGRIEAR